MLDTLPRIATSMNSGTDPRVLETLAMEGVSLAQWDRQLPADLAAELDALPTARLPRFRDRLPVSRIAQAVRNACDESGAPECGDRLGAEIEMLAGHAADLFASPLLDVRLNVTEGQPCPKWHVDALRARLLCTLRGPGTEYGPATKTGEPQTVHSMPRGAVGVFRGLLWPGRELTAIVHRSPPLAIGGPRLLLVIDPVDDAGRC